MKNLLRAIPLIVFIACQPSESGNSTTVSETSKVDTVITPGYTSMYAVSFEEAKQNIDYFASLIANNQLGVDSIRAFTLHAEDVLESIGLSPSYASQAEFQYLRIYLGADSTDSQFKIYLTPVIDADIEAGNAGKDVILEGPYDGDGDGLADSEGQYLMDFSKPCPNACDGNSPLNE